MTSLFCRPAAGIPAFALSITLSMVGAISNAGASGTGDYGGDGGFVKIDRLYEKGKAQYHAKDNSGQRTRYCIKNSDGLDRVSRKSLRVFTGTSADLLISNLYQCDQPERSIGEQLSGDKLNAVVYYLNKRYRLGLYGS